MSLGCVLVMSNPADPPPPLFPPPTPPGLCQYTGGGGLCSPRLSPVDKCSQYHSPPHRSGQYQAALSSMYMHHTGRKNYALGLMFTLESINQSTFSKALVSEILCCYWKKKRIWTQRLSLQRLMVRRLLLQNSDMFVIQYVMSAEWWVSNRANFLLCWRPWGHHQQPCH